VDCVGTRLLPVLLLLLWLGWVWFFVTGGGATPVSSGFTTSGTPSGGIGGTDVFVLPILELVEVECGLACDGIGVSYIGVPAGEGQP